MGYLDDLARAERDGKRKRNAVNDDGLLPEPPEGFCLQLSDFVVDSMSANERLEEITRKGGRVVAMWPAQDSPGSRWTMIAAYFWPMDDAADDGADDDEDADE